MKRVFACILALALLAAAFTACAQELSICVGTSLDGASNAQISNIRRAAAKINGAQIPEDAAFSFNEIVGPRTKAYGFQTAENGRGAEVTGGGVAQAATTLYLALVEYGADVLFDDLKFYGSRFAGSYADPSDAVLVDYSSGIDFAFTNRGGDMQISMWIEGGKLYCGLTIQQAQEDVFAWNERSEGRVPVATASIRLSGDNAIINNVRLAAGSINDTVLPVGSAFSFNSTVGPRTEENGFLAAPNGRGATVTGGGAAQVASAIWLAIRNCEGVAIAEKSTYGSNYNQSYVESSNDAIMVDYKTGRDFSFRNTGSEPLTICTYISGNELVCEIYRG